MMQMKEDNQTNVSSQLKIHQITSEKNEWQERYEVEAMTVDTLQKYLESLELDYQHIAKENDEKIQWLKKEKHEIHKSLHSAKKASDVDKEEIEFQKKEIERYKKEVHEMENKLQKMNNDYKSLQCKYDILFATNSLVAQAEKLELEIV